MSELNRNQPNSLSAALAGAMLGAGLAIAGAMALKDENVKSKVKKVVDDLLEKTDDAATDVKSEAGKTKEEIADVVSKTMDDVDEKINEPPKT